MCVVVLVGKRGKRVCGSLGREISGECVEVVRNSKCSWSGYLAKGLNLFLTSGG